MENNKENISKLKTRIPIPNPKPTIEIEKPLINQKSTVLKETSKRIPLRTLNTQPQLALPGPSNCTRKPKKQKMDAKLVTLRQRDENLDWDYAVFKDDRADEEVITISDDEDKKKVKFRFFVENKRKCHREARRADTPGIKSPSLALEPSRVRNVKRSLRRPHSRELLGLTPVCKEPKKKDEKVKRKLNFNEAIQERLRSPDFLKKSYTSCLCRDYASDVFEYLQGAEQRTVAPKLTSAKRAYVINWLMRVNGHDGNPAIIQTAIWYLDAVLCARQVLSEKLQLIAAACYWIARKLHGPGLSAARVVKFSNHAFDIDCLIAAESAILEILKFPRQPIIAQEYITYLSWWCDNKHPGEIEVATFVCIAGMMVDKSLCAECPSVVGAGAVRNALLLLSKIELAIKLELCPVFRTAEKKAENMSVICSIQRKAVRTIADPNYEYRTLIEHYGTAPHYIAQRVINVANHGFSNKVVEP